MGVSFLGSCVYENHIHKGEPVKNQVSERGQKQGAKTHKDGKIRIMNPYLYTSGNCPGLSFKSPFCRLAPCFWPLMNFSSVKYLIWLFNCAFVTKSRFLMHFISLRLFIMVVLKSEQTMID